MNGRIIVTGGVNIDIKGFSGGEIRGDDSNPGRITVSPGGVAGNIASALAALGAPVTLCTVLSDDQWGSFLIDKAKERGIDTSSVIIKPGGSSGAYLCLLQPTGELFSAVSDMHLLEELLREDITPWIGLLDDTRDDTRDDVRMIILDANLPSPILETLITEAHSREIPLIAEPVSTAKASRLVPFLDHLTYLTPNQVEYRQILERVAQLKQSVPGACGFAITRGAEGVRVIPPGMGPPAGSLPRGKKGAAGKPEKPIAPIAPAAREPFDRPAWPARIADVSGAGDAFTAGFCYALFTGASIEEAADMGLALAALNLESCETVRPDLSGELLALRMQEKRKR